MPALSHDGPKALVPYPSLHVIRGLGDLPRICDIENDFMYFSRSLPHFGNITSPPHAGKDRDPTRREVPPRWPCLSRSMFQ